MANLYLFRIDQIDIILDREHSGKYTAAERKMIKDSIIFLVDSFTLNKSQCIEQDISPEKYLTDAVIAYLEDNHSVHDLMRLTEISEVTPYFA